MSFGYDSNKNNTYDTMRDEFAWHNQMFIGLFVDINELNKSNSYFYGFNSFRSAGIRRFAELLES